MENQTSAIQSMLYGLTVPVGNVLVCDTRCDIKHDDTTLPVDIVAISESTKLFLPGGVPDIELDASVVL